MINHDGVSTIYKEILKLKDLDVLVLDELAVYRSGLSKRSKLMTQVAKKFRWVWGMTGAPTPNSQLDVWGQARIITPARVNDRFTHFRDELMLKVSDFKWLPKKDATDRAFAALQPAVRYTLDDVMELPEELPPRLIQVGMGKEQTRVYDELRKHAYVLVKNKEITAMNAGVVLMKLLQVSSGYVYSKDTVVELDNGARLQALEDLILSTDRKVIVFAPFRHTLDGIHKHLSKAGYDVANPISGDMPQTERNEIFNHFQNTSKYKVIAAHPKTMAHGLTLTAADTIVWFAPITSNETFEQANARIRRIGQRHKQQVLLMHATPVEKRIYSLLATRHDVQEKLLSMFQDGNEEWAEPSLTA